MLSIPRRGRLDEQASIIKLSQLAWALKGRMSSLLRSAGMAYGMMSPQFMAWIGSEFGSSNLRINAVTLPL